MNKRNIVKAFNPSLDKYNLALINEMSLSENNSFRGKELVSSIEKLIIDKTADLKNKLEVLSIKTNSALFGSKKFINESYAFEIPLTKDYFLHPERAEFKDNILTTKLSTDGSTDKIHLNVAHLTSRRGTDFKLVGNTLSIEKNPVHNYQEIEVHIPKEIISGYLHLNLDKYDNISVLDRYGRELVDKHITKEITHVVTNETKSLVFRFHTNKTKSFNILDLHITKENFSLYTEIETKPIRIGHTLSQLAINTCDNYSDNNINIQYHMSINGEEYKEIRPLNKQKNLHLNSILSVDTNESYYHLTEYTTVHNKMLFVTDDIPSTDMHIKRAFKYKLGVDEGLIRGRVIHLYAEKDAPIILHKDDSITVNDKLIVASKDNTEIILKKGFNSISVKESLLKEQENLLNKTNIKISEDYKSISYTNTIDGKTYTKLIDFNPNTKDKNSLAYQLITLGDIYLEPITAIKVSVNNTLYIEKDSLLDGIHLFIKNRLLRVDTVQLKMKLESTSKSNPAYISSLTIRGTQ